MNCFKKKQNTSCLDSLELVYNELQKMHEMLRNWDDDYLHLNTTKNEFFNRILEYQDTLLKIAKKMCGLKH